jgi:hypothetical protein
MKKLVITLSFILTTGLFTFGQSTDPLISKCLADAGIDAKYLKDFRIQLGEAPSQSELRYKANISLWKDMKYRFATCCTEDSKGKLILNIKDDANRIVLSSFDPKTGKAYPFVEFICSKSGVYQVSYDFTNEKKGSGVGVVLVVK